MTQMQRIAFHSIWLTALLGVLLIGSTLYGQQITGSLTVRVGDPTHAQVVGATVTLTNTATNVKTTGMTLSDGSFVFSLLQPGRYNVDVTDKGFKAEHLTDITVEIGEAVAVTATLAVGAATESLSVSAESESMLNTESASVGQVENSATVSQLPLNGRDVVQLVYLTTGATPSINGDAAATTWVGRQNVTVILGGLRESDTSYLVDGVETRNPRFGNASLLLSPDAIQEFRVQRSTFGPEFGLSASVINMTLRGGANAIHGDAFELNRNKDYSANTYFANQAGLAQPALNQNQFGATMAGPLLIPKLYNGKDRTFFMFNYEGFRQIQGNTLTGIYPSAAQLAGNLADDSAGTGIYPLNSPFCSSHPGSVKCANVINPFTGNPYPGNVISGSGQGGLDPVDQKFLPYFHAPNVLTSAGSASYPSYNTIASPGSTRAFDQYNARVDEVLTQNDRIYATFSDVNDHEFEPLLRLLGGSSYPFADHLWTVNYTHTFSPTIVNELRLGTNDAYSYFVPQTAYGPNYAQTIFGFKNTTQDPLTFGIPDLSIAGVGAVGSWPEAIGSQDKNYQLADNLSITRGEHSYQAGVELIHERFSQVTDFDANPAFTFSGLYTGLQTAGYGLADFLIGAPYIAAGAAGDSAQNLHTNYYGVFAGDHWQFRPNLMFSYGLRYEYSLNPVEAQNHQGVFNFNLGEEQYVGDPGVYRSIIEPDHTQFAPRLGFAWQPRFLKNSVLRGGIGIYYATDDWNEDQFSIVGTKYYEVESIVGNEVKTGTGPPTPNLSMENLLPSFAASNSTNPFTLEPKARTQYYDQWSLDLQKTFGKYLLELEYSGNLGADQWIRVNGNQATLDPTGTIPIVQREPYPDYGYILYSRMIAASNYNALTAKMETHFANGLSFLGALTYANAIDDGNLSDSSAISADFRLYDHGHSDANVPLRFVFSGLYELPFGQGKMLLSSVPSAVNYLVGGWQLNTITTISEGAYATAVLPSDWLNIGAFSTSRANVDRSLVQQGRKLPTRWFNPAAFSFPATHIEGNSGRNTLREPGYWNSDLSLFKSIPIRENVNFQLRLEAFNAFNNVQWGQAGAAPPPSTGAITSTSPARIVQVGGRLQW